MDSVSILIVDKGQDLLGVVANASFVLGLTAGRSIGDETFGHEVVDGDGKRHKRLTSIGHYVRKAGPSKLRAIRDEFADHPDVEVVDYPEAAAPADYNAYEQALASQAGDQITYRAVHLYGPADVLVPKTKNLSKL